MTNKIRVRYAPSPTGFLHIGNARTALFNYLFARSQNGTFIIRIEDTDAKRNVAGGEANQLHYLKWLGLDWDEGIDVGGEHGPYRQTERADLYTKYAQQLLENGRAYKCYCTEEELEAQREMKRARNEMPRYIGRCRNLTDEERAAFEAEGREPNIRFKVPGGKTYAFRDIVKERVAFDSDGVGDFVILKKDGLPTYNFAVVIDDHYMEISHVLRGDDHLSNTPRQLMIYEALGWKPPIFGHMTLIVNEERRKLSKRDEEIIQYIEQYEELGYLPEAMFNFITLLGWSPVGEEEIFTQQQFIDMFDANRLSKSPAVFDTKKLTWMNNEYIKNSDVERIITLAFPHLIKAGRLPEDMENEQRKWAEQLIALYQEQLSYGAEIVELTNLFFQTEISYNEEAKKLLSEEEAQNVVQAFYHEIEGLTEFTPAAVKAATQAVQEKTGQRGRRLFMPIRVATTGQMQGPELPVSISLLGQETVKKRLHGLINK